jgi:arsenical pump membrane protein
VSFWRFLKVGVVAMPIALLVSVGGAILVKVLFHTQ